MILGLVFEKLYSQRKGIQRKSIVPIQKVPNSIKSNTILNKKSRNQKLNEDFLFINFKNCRN